MADEIQIWAIDKMDGSTEITKVEPTSRTETETLLEDALVKDPDILMPGLTLVGRQTPIAGGYLDLLGVDKEGQLIVFELKRGKLTREAVTQVIDYCSALESMSDADRAALIAERSGQLGITRIEDFEEWYGQRFEEQTSLTPVRMVLVGLTMTMPALLARERRGHPLLTFYGSTTDVVEPQGSPRLGREALRKALANRAERLGMGNFWKEVAESFTNLAYNGVPLRTALSFCLQEAHTVHFCG